VYIAVQYETKCTLISNRFELINSLLYYTRPAQTINKKDVKKRNKTNVRKLLMASLASTSFVIMTVPGITG